MPAADPVSLGDDATTEALRLLNALRRETIGSILSAPQPLSGSLRELLHEIDTLIVTFGREMSGAMGRHVERAGAAGDEAVLDDLRAARLDVPLSYMGVSPSLVRTAAEYVSDLITGLSSDARQRITREVRLAALGGMGTTDLIDRIGRNLTDPSVFGTIATRAEMIARTEVSRVRAMAFHEQATEAAARYPGMRKRWEHSSSSPGFTTFQSRKSRPNHVALAALDPIPVDEPFMVGGVAAMYPHDPNLPAKETVNCRCRLVLVAPEPETEQSASDAIEFPPNEHGIHDKEGLHAWAQQHFGDWRDSLTDDELALLHDYTDGGYRDINRELRGGSQSSATRATVVALDDIMGRVSLPQDALVYRGIASEASRFANVRAGDVITDAGFVSTTLNRAIADNFSVYKSKVHKTVATIRVPAGSNAVPVAALSPRSWNDAQWDDAFLIEAELILPRGARFRVTNSREIDGVTHLDLVLDGHGVIDESLHEATLRKRGEKPPKFIWELGDIKIQRRNSRLIALNEQR